MLTGSPLTAYQRFLSGPPGGLTLPYTKIRLSDIEGGVYGPGASAASTGWAARRPAIQAVLSSRPGSGSESDSRRVEDMLEFYTYHANSGEPSHMLVLAKIYYHGSLWGAGETAGAVARDYKRALNYLLRIASQVWPRDSASVRRGGPARSVAKRGEHGEDVKLPNVDMKLAMQAGAAAGMIGRMYLRGEGVAQDFYRAWVWFQRGVDQGDLESYNGIGIMLRDGLGMPSDVPQAVQYFEAAAGNTPAHADSCVNYAKVMYDMGEYGNAEQWFRTALAAGNSFEGYYYLAKIAAQRFDTSPDSADMCRSAVLGFKRIVERGDWDNPVFHVAEKAWRTGHREKALLGWMMAGERGYEAAQNNVAWILDRDKRLLRLPFIDDQETEDNSTDRLALLQWTRSAAQDNVDAMVKMGDYYFRGYGTDVPGVPSYVKAASCYQAAADRQSSALAYWNMGWMYESGLGVPRQDFYLAKRYYDMAWEINESEAYLPVLLSLIRLHFRALWATATRGDSSAISLWSSYAGAASDVQAYTEAEELALQEQASRAVSDNQREAVQDRRYAENREYGDPNLPESYDTRRFDEQRFDEGEDGDFGDEGSLEGLLLAVGISSLAFFVWLRQRVQLRLQEQEQRQRQEQERRQEPQMNQEARQDVA